MMIYFGEPVLKLRVLHEVHLLTRTPVTPVLCCMISQNAKSQIPRKEYLLFFIFISNLSRSSFI